MAGGSLIRCIGYASWLPDIRTRFPNGEVLRRTTRFETDLSFLLPSFVVFTSVKGTANVISVQCPASPSRMDPLKRVARIVGRMVIRQDAEGFLVEVSFPPPPLELG